MRVILKENVLNLGQIGDVVSVSPGYARNYLIPRDLVSPANEGNIRALDHQKKILEKRRNAEKQKFVDIAKKLEDFTCNISRKVGEKEKIFGSVGPADVAEALNKAGFEIDKRIIRIEDQIKKLGKHSAEVQLHPDVVAKVKVFVVKEE